MVRKFMINFHRKSITCLCDLEYLHGTKAIIEIAQGKEIQDSVGFRVPVLLLRELGFGIRIVS